MLSSWRHLSSKVKKEPPSFGKVRGGGGVSAWCKTEMKNFAILSAFAAHNMHNTQERMQLAAVSQDRPFQ